MEEECVIHMVSQALIKSVNLSAKKLKRNESEVSAFGIELTDSVKIAAPSIKKTIFQMECELHQHITRLMGNYYATHYEMEKL